MTALFGRTWNKPCCCGTDTCCYPRCEPLKIATVGEDTVEVVGDCENPLPLNLACDLTAIGDPEGYTCFNGSGTLVFRTPLSDPPGDLCWEGEISGTCVDCNANTFNWTVTIKVCCNADTGQHIVSMVPGSGMLCPATTLTGVTTFGTCDPFLAQGCFPEFGGCMVCMDFGPSFLVCYDVYEVPI